MPGVDDIFEGAETLPLREDLAEAAPLPRSQLGLGQPDPMADYGRLTREALQPIESRLYDSAVELAEGGTTIVSGDGGTAVPLCALYPLVGTITAIDTVARTYDATVTCGEFTYEVMNAVPRTRVFASGQAFSMNALVGDECLIVVIGGTPLLYSVPGERMVTEVACPPEP